MNHKWNTVSVAHNTRIRGRKLWAAAFTVLLVLHSLVLLLLSLIGLTPCSANTDIPESTPETLHCQSYRDVDRRNDASRRA